MTALTTNDILNRVLVVHNRSLPVYLQDAAPWYRHGEDDIKLTLDAIANDHHQIVDRIANLILDNSGTVELGEYPMVFTAYHDVSFDFLLPVLIDRQQRMIAYLEGCAEQLRLAPMARAVVEETIGMAKGHLEMLEELKKPRSERRGLPRASTNGDGHNGHHAPSADLHGEAHDGVPHHGDTGTRSSSAGHH